MAEGGSIASPILSTAGEDVGTMAGTSIAVAQVTGAASLVWEANPELNYRQIIEALKSTATDNLPILGEFGKVTIGAELKAEAYISPGTFDTSFEALFNISYPEQVQAGSMIQLDINPSFQGDAIFKSQLGASLFASGKMFTTLETNHLGEFNLELGTKVDHDTLSALVGIPGSLDLGLSTNTDKLENNQFLEAEDKAGLTLNAIDLFKLPLPDSVQDIVSSNLKLDIEQDSVFDIKGFTINLDWIDNGSGDVKDFMFETSEPLFFEIPSDYMLGNTYEFSPTIKPIVELNSKFDVVRRTRVRIWRFICTVGKVNLGQSA